MLLYIILEDCYFNFQEGRPARLTDQVSSISLESPEALDMPITATNGPENKIAYAHLINDKCIRAMGPS